MFEQPRCIRTRCHPAPTLLASANTYIPKDRRGVKVATVDVAPTPTARQTTIAFQIVEAYHVRFSAHDVEGRLVSLLHSGRMDREHMFLNRTAEIALVLRYHPEYTPVRY